MGRLLTTKEAAALLGLKDASSIRHYVERGYLQATKTGRDLFIDEAHLATFERPKPGPKGPRKARKSTTE